MAEAKRGIRGALAAHLAALRAQGHQPRAEADITVLRQDTYLTKRERLRFVSVGALLGHSTSPAKAASSRRNGRAGGGRPPVAVGGR